ncbi:3-dehydroquinate synthase [Subsaxibacter sp. CAU 1640]|uniref:3-dehydroquinate synthase n=1 Tax=Subsaxibacter sp. CAU 1640 TaxID=2933271 RepID=UPI002003BB0D|nr:3-dehydroquinate synthase [Subsaxibacter sp. CAU 1640]MCK7591046.1 3-dehydroquinate synthase [Subsaxibacter sp. CAU 1640]
MISIKASNYSVHFNNTAYRQLNLYLEQNVFSKLFVLVDTNTNQHCFPNFMSRLETNLNIEIIEIEAGEAHKTIETCLGVWNALSELGGDRKSILINLGGGVVTDLGGFVASTFKRGIKYVNVPTSLLSMVDASIGGKNGVDLGVIKNQIGVINSGEMVIVDTTFLDTLPQNQLKSGWAEMLKHGLIAEIDYWKKLSDLSQLTLEDLDQLIYNSIIIKNTIVNKDPYEIKERKHLNFGHTLGHAIESYFLSSKHKNELLHGEAIAIGMILECYLSYKLLNFPKSDCDEVKNVINSLFQQVDITSNDYESIIELLKFDKKNEHGNVNFVLLEALGKPKVNCLVENDLILEAFDYYKN